MDRQEIFKFGKMRKYDSGSEIKKPLDKSKKSDCEDDIEINVSSLSPTVSGIRFSHRGCLLSRAAMNALIESIQDKTKDDAVLILSGFKKMITGYSYSELPERLMLFKKFVKFPSRISCLLLGCELMLKTLNPEE